MISDSDTFTLTDCYPDDNSFLLGFMFVVVLFAIGYVLWRIFVTNRTRPVGTNVLGLNENPVTYSESSTHRIPWGTLLLYTLTFVTFAFEAYRYVIDLLSSVNVY